MNKQEQHIVSGMSRDSAINQFSPKLVYEAKNIRITARGESTLLSVTNERGTKPITLEGGSIEGTPIGSAVINDYLVLFTTACNAEEPQQNSRLEDHIYRIQLSDTEATGNCISLFSGYLGFSTKHPIETLPLFENKDLQKVYWVDGYNQPRVVNIADTSLETTLSNPDSMNFSREVALDHTIKVTKRNTGGTFAAGTVQYAFAYFNKFGQESRIFDYTPLYYLSPKERGLSADSTSSCSFEIKLKNLDNNFNYIRAYAIVRSSANATPNCRIVGDYPIAPLEARYRYRKDGTLDSELNTGGSAASYIIYDSATDTITPLTEIEITETTAETETRVVTLSTTQVLMFTSGNNAYVRNTEEEITLTVVDNLEDGRMYISPAEGQTAEYGSYVKNSGTGITIIDNGVYGSTIDATALLYIGGEELVASTIAQKDNTMFLGNIKLTKPNIGTLNVEGRPLKEAVRASVSDNLKSCQLGYTGSDYTHYSPSKEGFYNYEINNNRNSQETKKFKFGENYRLGFIAQYKNGAWSEAIWLSDKDNLVRPKVLENRFITGGWKFTLPTAVRKALTDAGYKRVAPVAVYPSMPDRRVLCQGFLCPTVYNVKDRYQNGPFAQSSWYFRFTGYKGIPHGQSLYSNYTLAAEIQALQDHTMMEPCAQYHKSGGDWQWMSNDEFADYFAEDFFVDFSILTFHSPDIEFNSELTQADFEDVKLRVVGFADMTNYGWKKTEYHDIHCSTKSIGINTTHSEFLGTVNSQYARGLFADSEVDVTNQDEVRTFRGDENSNSLIVGFQTYPWHRSGSLNNQPALTSKQSKNGYSRTAELQYKRWSSIYYARTNFAAIQTSYISDLNNSKQGISIRTPQLFNSDQMQAIKVPAPANSNLNSLIYYGNIDKILTPNSVDMSNLTLRLPNTSSPSTYDEKSGLDKTRGYPIIASWIKAVTEEVPNDDTWNNGNYYEANERLMKGYGSVPYYTNALLWWEGTLKHKKGDADETYDDIVNIYPKSNGSWSKDPISMKYKSTPHLVIALDYTSAMAMNTLPEALIEKRIQKKSSYQHTPFWASDDHSYSADNPFKVSDYDIGIAITSGNGLWVGELYRSFTDEQLASRFGGKTEAALSANIWLRCGDIINLEEDEYTLTYAEGDTYLERYDCLKTYPYTNEDPNSVIEIFSSEVETRVNLDARYDRNRGLQSNIAMSPVNFNLFNHLGYEQTNNFFNYQAIDYERFKSMHYPNMITWSTEKILGEDIDSWTDIDVTSVLDLDGDKGKVVSLNIYNNEIYAFQNRGFAQLLFNSRVQIPTSDGQPIEITNGLKMQGKRYISSMIGCSNKWSIRETPSGLYFLDDETNSIYRFSNQLEDISTKCGMRSWIETSSNFNIWNPREFENLVTYYDKSNQDLYFVSKDWCLVYSEQLGQFTSFMDYEATPLMVNLRDNFYAFTSNGSTSTPWWMFNGEYNHFFGEYKPYWMTFISNDNPTIDKVFNNLEFRTEVWSGDTFQPMSTFDTLRVWNEHQDSGEVPLVTAISGVPANLKKKFNTWKVNIPRDATVDSTGAIVNHGMNRIRNPWAYIKLGTTKEEARKAMKLQFTDMIVDYFM